MAIHCAVHNFTVQRLHAPAVLNQESRQPVQQFGMGGAGAVEAKITGGFYQAGAKVPLPNTVHNHAGEQRVGGVGNPGRQPGAAVDVGVGVDVDVGVGVGVDVDVGVGDVVGAAHVTVPTMKFVPPGPGYVKCSVAAAPPRYVTATVASTPGDPVMKPSPAPVVMEPKVP